MKMAIVLVAVWLVLAAVRIQFVESWSILPDGSPNHWWNLVGIRVFIALLFVEIAVLRRWKIKS